MYNEERKLQFIQEEKAESTHETAKSIFNKFERTEELEDMDLCEFPYEVLQNVIDSKFAVYTKTSADSMIAVVKSYITWCKRKGYPVSDAINNIVTFDPSRKKSLKPLMVGSPEELRDLLDKAFDLPDEGTNDSIYRCFLWMAYSGLKNNEAIEVKSKDVDLLAMEIHYNGKHYPIYRQAVKDFKIARDSDKFRYKHPNYDESISIYKDRVESEYLLRSPKSAKPTVNTAMWGVRDHALKANIEIRYSSIFMSGIYYRAFETDCRGMGTPSLGGYIREQILKLEEKDTYSPLREARIKRDVEKGYQAWKNLFIVKLE